MPSCSGFVTVLRFGFPCSVVLLPMDSVSQETLVCRRERATQKSIHHMLRSVSEYTEYEQCCCITGRLTQ